MLDPRTPYPDEADVLPDELGIRALPDDASPAEKARAEALWRPVGSDRPCRCSGGCYHGDACSSYEDDCDGRLVHTDRQAASMLSLHGWQDNYECDTCGEAPASDIGVDLPDIPWGEKVSDHGFRAFPDVRHPNFRSTWPVATDDD